MRGAARRGDGCIRTLAVCAACAALTVLSLPTLDLEPAEAHHAAQQLRAKQLRAAHMERVSRQARRWPRVRHWRAMRVRIKRLRVRLLREHRCAYRGGTVTRNIRLGRCMAARPPYRWRGAQWQCLRALWHRESGWRHWARNPSSGAFGIVQALPASKLYAAGRAIHTARVQIRWGLRYVERRYGTPCAALHWHDARGWY